MKHSTFLYITIIALVTYLIRTLPLTLIRKQIKNKFIKSFLYYVPYVTLAAMTFPAIITATQNPIAGFLAFAVAILVAWISGNLFLVAVSACSVVFLAEMILSHLPM